ncbi:MAG: hypothetical protein IJ484_01065 [Oscillospiraceae bacterium]|nr:hypothetical protein [Oscillospiraceae bacterium]
MIRLFYWAGLALLALAAVLLWLPALYRAFRAAEGPASARLGALLRQELSPLPPALAQHQGRIGQWLFTLGTVLYLTTQVVSNTSVPGLSLLRSAGSEAAILLFFAKITLFTRTSPGQILCAGVCAAPFVLSQQVDANRLVLLAILFVLAGRSTDLRPALKLSAGCVAVFYAVCVALDRLHITDRSGDIFRYVGGVPQDVRYALGFGHPNTAAYFLALLATAWLLLRWKQLRWWDWALGLAALYLITFPIDSRGSMLNLCITLALMLLFRVFPRFLRLRPIAALIPLAPAVCTLASLCGAYLYDPSNGLWSRLNALSSGRLYLFNLAAQSYAITPFGQDLNDPRVYTLDNAYLKLLFQTGLPALVLFVLGLTLLLRRLVRAEAAPELAVALSGCVYCLFETAGALPTANLSLWLLSALAWGIGPHEQTLFAPDAQNTSLRRP